MKLKSRRIVHFYVPGPDAADKNEQTAYGVLYSRTPFFPVGKEDFDKIIGKMSEIGGTADLPLIRQTGFNMLLRSFLP